MLVISHSNLFNTRQRTPKYVAVEKNILQFLKKNGFQECRINHSKRGINRARRVGRFNEFKGLSQFVDFSYVLKDEPGLKIGLIAKQDKLLGSGTKNNLSCTLNLSHFESILNALKESESKSINKDWVAKSGDDPNNFHKLFILNNKGCVTDLTEVIQNKAYEVKGHVVEISNEFDQDFLPIIFRDGYFGTEVGPSLKELFHEIKTTNDKFRISNFLSRISYEKGKNFKTGNSSLKSDLILSIFVLIYYLSRTVECRYIINIITSNDKNNLSVLKNELKYISQDNMFIDKVFQLCDLIVDISENINDNNKVSEIFNNFSFVVENHDLFELLSSLDLSDVEKIIYECCFQDPYYDDDSINHEIDIILGKNQDNITYFGVNHKVPLYEPHSDTVFFGRRILFANTHSYFYIKKIFERVDFEDMNMFYVYNDSYISRLMHCIDDLSVIQVQYVDEVFVEDKKDLENNILAFVDLSGFIKSQIDENIFSLINYFQNNQMLLRFDEVNKYKTNSLSQIYKKLKEILISEEVCLVTQFALTKQICMYLNKKLAKRKDMLGKIIFQYTGGDDSGLEPKGQKIKVNKNDSIIEKFGFSTRFYKYHELFEVSKDDIYLSEILNANQVSMPIGGLWFKNVKNSSHSGVELTINKILEFLDIDNINCKKVDKNIGKVIYSDAERTLNYSEICSFFEDNLVDLQNSCKSDEFEKLHDSDISYTSNKIEKSRLTLYDKGEYIIISKYKDPLQPRRMRRDIDGGRYSFELVQSEHPFFVKTTSYVFSINSDSVISTEDLFKKLKETNVKRQVCSIDFSEFLNSKLDQSNESYVLSLLGNVRFNKENKLSYAEKWNSINHNPHLPKRNIYNPSVYKKQVPEMDSDEILDEKKLITVLSDPKKTFEEKESFLLNEGLGHGEVILFLEQFIENSANKKVQDYFNIDFHTLKENFKDIFYNYSSILKNINDDFKDFVKNDLYININYDKKWLKTLPKHFDDLGSFFANLYNLEEITIVDFINEISDILEYNRKKNGKKIELNFDAKLFKDVEVLDSLNGINMSEKAYIKIPNEFSEAVFQEFITNSIKYAWHNYKVEKKVIDIRLAIENHVIYDPSDLNEDQNGNLIPVQYPTKINQRKLRIFYADNGVGIPDKSKLFNCGERFDMQKTSISGTGHGICKAKKIIEVSNGTIDYYSEDNSNSFHILLPIEEK